MTISKIMIVDDDEDVRTVSEVVARRVGRWEVSLAASGEEALERATLEQPDVILLDVMMPGLDGPETLARLRQQPSTATIPVIFLTARAQSHDVARYLELGANGVVTKPFDAMTLPDEIRRIVGRDSPRAGTAKPEIVSELAQLREEYRHALPAEVERLRELVAAARAGGEAELGEAEALAHKLKGTTGFYRLAAVSAAIQGVEAGLRKLMSVTDPSARTEAWDETDEALAQALRETDRLH